MSIYHGTSWDPLCQITYLWFQICVLLEFCRWSVGDKGGKDVVNFANDVQVRTRNIFDR